MRRRALVATLAALLAGCGEDQMTREEAERLARGGAFFDREACGKPTKVECLPVGERWACTVTWRGGGSASGELDEDQELQVIGVLC